MRIQLVLPIMLMLLISGLAQAEEVPVVNGVGEVSIVEKPKDSRFLSQEEMMAFANPGQEIPINSHTIGYRKADFWHLMTIKEYSEVLVFADGKIQTIPKTGTIDGQLIVAIYMVFCLVTIVLMAMSDLFMVGSKSDTNTFASFVFATFAFVTTIFTFFATATVFVFATLAVLVSLVFAFIIVVTVDKNNTKVYWVCSFVFYVSIVIAMLI